MRTCDPWAQEASLTPWAGSGWPRADLASCTAFGVNHHLCCSAGPLGVARSDRISRAWHGSLPPANRRRKLLTGRNTADQRLGRPRVIRHRSAQLAVLATSPEETEASHESYDLRPGPVKERDAAALSRCPDRGDRAQEATAGEAGGVLCIAAARAHRDGGLRQCTPLGAGAR
jgi:hypothetical protein